MLTADIFLAQNAISIYKKRTQGKRPRSRIFPTEKFPNAPPVPRSFETGKTLSGHLAGMKRIIEIEFDGGTSCNIPRLGYGIGYGSYMIDGGHPVRINHGRAMSANAAEIWTLVRAMESILEAAENPQDIILHVGGDSQIALARCRPKKAKKKTKPCKSSGEFVDSCEALLTCCAQFAEVVTRWRSRAVSVHLFGH